MNKTDKIWLFITSIIILAIVSVYSTVTESRTNEQFVSNLPTEMVDSISSQIGSNDNEAIKQYYLQNFPQLENLAYEYHWY